MKKVFSVLLCVVSVLVFCAFPFGMAVFADDIVSSAVNFGKDYIQNYSLPGIVYKYLNSSQKKLEAARSYYFYCITNDTFLSSCTVFDSSGIKFTDEILNFYYEQYTLACKGLSDVYVSDGDIYLSAAGFPDVPFSLRLLGFSTSNFSDFKNYYNTFLARYLLEQGETATDPNPGKSGLDIAPGYVSSEELVEGIEKDNSYFTPKGELTKISYRTDDTFQKYVNFPSTARKSAYMPYIIDNNHFVSIGGTEEMYFLFFFQDDTNEYVSEYQFRLYFEVKTNYDDSGSVVSVEKYPRLQIWSSIDGSPSEPIEFLDSTSDCSEYKYFSIQITKGSSCFSLVGYKTFTDFLNSSRSRTWDKVNFTSTYCNLYLPDFSGSTDYSFQVDTSSHGFCGSYDYHSSQPCKYNDNCDIGLYVSSTPIDFTYRDIDTTKIPSNQIITINGDTIYNYTITNPETGESSKFGDYITNNYTYITNNYGEGESSGSGSGVGGNVTVGGSIDVGGSVGVDVTVSVPDININVNGNGSGAGESVSLPDTDLVENLPEAPSGFIDYTASLFSFLPAEILSLLLAGLAAAIFCRIWGR